MRLLAVIMGSPSESARVDDSERLINYGFRFFETHELYKAGQAVTQMPVYKGKSNSLKVGMREDQYVTIPNGQYQHLNINTKIPGNLQAPITKGDRVGELVIQFDNNVIANYPLYALEEVPKGGIYTRMRDSIRLTVKGWFGAKVKYP
jgi:serine-type D-Ala-D-Ala carboxypeptidase (penicillin-binding protein 5/6)